jgi:hypothetical protein
MRRTTLAIALATGALAVPGVALATGDGDSPTQPESSTTAPVQQQPRDHDCPEGQDGGSGGGSSDTQL